MEDLHSDPRFAHIHSDPKFRLMPKSKRKVKIDSRFESLFSNKHFSHKTNVDKRGRPALSSSRDKHVMSRFYHLSHDDDEPAPLDVKQVKQKKKGISQRHVSDKSQTRPSKGRKYTACEDDYHYNLAQNLLTKLNHQVSPDVTRNKEQQTNQDDDDVQTSEEEEEDVQTSEEEELAEFNQEFVMEETEVDHKWNELHADADQVVESTRRLAVCNMDWDFVKAQDLFILFKSFVPENGHIKCVTIYPSEFGKQRMAEEARLGPQEMREYTQEQGSRAGKRKEQDSRTGKRKEQDSRTGKRKEQGNRTSKSKEHPTDNHQAKQCEQQQEEAAAAGTAQTEKLREYQLNRLRYYFAVVECDCVATADSVYSQCDGREYQLSSIKLDLRFIPNDMTFQDQPKDMFSQEQSIVNYQPHRFTSTALSQAKVDVTWDQTDFDRLSHSVAKLQHKELEAIVEENKFSDIIAPPESDSEEEEQQDNGGRPSWLQAAMEEEDGGKILTEEEKISVYRKVLMSKLADDDDEENVGELDQEYVWQPGLKLAAEKKVQRKERREANTGLVTQLLDKRKAKKRRKKEERLKKKKAECADDDDEVVAEANTGGDSAKSSLKKKKRLGSKGSTEQRAQLQLLFMDSSSSKNNDDDVVETKRKKKQKNCAASSAADSDEFVLDVDDPRFAALYTSHHFHIDPNSSQFKKSKNMQALLDEQIKKRSHMGASKNSNLNKSSSSNISHLLLQSLKRKIIK